MDNEEFVILLQKATGNDKSAIYEIIRMYEKLTIKNIFKKVSGFGVSFRLYIWGGKKQTNHGNKKIQNLTKICYLFRNAFVY